MKKSKTVYLDIRDLSERNLFYIPDSVHIPLQKLTEKTVKEIPTDAEIIVYCSTGCQSENAVEILNKLGIKKVSSLKGGMNEWKKNGKPVIYGPGLDKDDIERYLRQMTLKEIGIEGQKKLLSAKVLLIGIGGLGSPAAFYLAGAGIGTIGMIDDDHVELDNLHRQIVHTFKSVGEPKVKSASRTISAFNPDIKIKTYHERLLEKNIEKIFSEYDVMVDCSDNFETRYLANRTAVKLSKPLVHGSILKFFGQVTVFDVTKDSPCYECIYPVQPPETLAPKCVESGVIGVIPGIIGTMQALEVIKLVVGLGEPLLGKLLIYDGLTCKTKQLDVKRDPNCGVCGR